MLCQPQIADILMLRCLLDADGLQKFVNIVGEISENESHHPDISFGWGYANIKIYTHAVEGLSENDFILASKIDDSFNV